MLKPTPFPVAPFVLRAFSSVLLCLSFAGCAGAWRSCGDAPDALTTEYRRDPIGLDCARPRLAWRMAAAPDAANERQSAWRVIASSTPELLADDKGDLWDSGKIESTTGCTVWAGRPLVSSQRVWWKAMTWNAAGKASDWSAPAHFTMGVMEAKDWKAKWIGPNAATRPDVDFGTSEWLVGHKLKGSLKLDRAPAPDEVISCVHLATRPHTIRINGTPVQEPSGQVLDWRWPRFRNFAPYLHAGENTIEVEVKPDFGSYEDLARVPASAAFICVFRRHGKPFAGTDATWKGGAVAGGVRAPAWGRAAILREEIASPAFARSFTLAKPLRRATLHVTGVGFYEARLNGVKVGDKVLDPSPTTYSKRVLYSTYEVEDLLRTGANDLQLLVGHGWYDVRSLATWNFDNAPWRDFPRCLAQLELVYADGTCETVATDASWRQVASPVGYDCIREGEVVGAADVRAPDFTRTRLNAEVVPAPAGRLAAESLPGAKIVRTIRPTAIHPCGPDAWLVEFPEAMAGWIRADFRGLSRGDVVVIRYDERVGAGFTPAVPSSHSGANNDSARATGEERRRIDCHFRYTCSHEVCAAGAEFQADRFVSAGASVERYEPRFTYNGFQYVLLKGLKNAPKPEDVVGCVVSTDFPTIGRFACSDRALNKLLRMAERSYRSNFVDGYPTDCPHREKNGWTGDASIASEYAQYQFENTAAYEKFLADIADAQLPDGNIPGIVPSSGWGFKWGNGPAWDSALGVIAWNLWCYRGDRRALDIAYPALARLVDHTATKANADALVGHGLGDWIPTVRQHMPTLEFTSSCFYLQAQTIASRMAAIKGLKADAERFAAGAERTRDGLRKAYMKPCGVWDNGRQTAQAYALAFGLCKSSVERDATAAALVESVVRCDCHLDVGLLGMKQIFRQLGEIGRTDLAYRLLTQKTHPSPMEWLQKGGEGSGMWEDWKDGASRNHIMFGDLGACAYQYFAGIRLPEGGTSAVPEPRTNGLRDMLIAPQFVDGLDWVQASVDLPVGRVAVAWRRVEGGVRVNVDVPPNTTATLRLRGRRDERIASGRHEAFVAD